MADEPKSINKLFVLKNDPDRERKEATLKILREAQAKAREMGAVDVTILLSNTEQTAIWDSVKDPDVRLGRVLAASVRSIVRQQIASMTTEYTEEVDTDTPDDQDQEDVPNE